MKVYTIREAAKETKIGMETLKKACKEGLINAVALPNGQWRIAESALQEALHKGIDLRSLPKKPTKKVEQPEPLKKAKEKMQKAKKESKSSEGKKRKKQEGNFPEKPDCDEWIEIKRIVIPPYLLSTELAKNKTDKIRNYVKANNTLDEAILVDKNTMTLKDKYRRYVVAKENNFSHVPVKWDA